MRIAIDNGPLTSGHAVRGVGTHTRELIQEIKKIKNNNLEIEAVDFSQTDLTKFDIVHYQFFNPFYVSLPFSNKAKTVVTIHDLIPLLYPDHYKPGIKGRISYLINKLLVSKADAVITISQTSKKDIVRLLGVKESKVHVAYLAPKKVFKKIIDKKTLGEAVKKYNLPKQFILYVGDVNYNKNIPTLIKAAKIAKMPLVIVGKQAIEIDGITEDMRSIKGPQDFIRFLLGMPHPELAHYQEIIKGLEDNPDIYRLGFVSDEDLVSIYNLATVYCQPSLYEGFGLPALEAIYCGTAVAASRTQALVEILGKSASYFDPKDTQEMVNAILNSKRKSELPREYSWEKTAKETVEVYESV